MTRFEKIFARDPTTPLFCSPYHNPLFHNNSLFFFLLMPLKVVCQYESDDDGNGIRRKCHCPKFESRRDQDLNQPVICRDCLHLKNWHEPAASEEDTVQNVFNLCDAKLLGMKSRGLTTKLPAVVEAPGGSTLANKVTPLFDGISISKRYAIRRTSKKQRLALIYVGLS
jgi:hypothetical protein